MEVARKKVTFEYFKAVMEFMERRFPGQMEMLETTREGPDTKFEARLQQYRLKNKAGVFTAFTVGLMVENGKSDSSNPVYANFDAKLYMRGVGVNAKKDKAFKEMLAAITVMFLG